MNCMKVMNSAGKPKMARQDSDVMTMVIFVSTDPIELPHELDYINHPEEEWRKQTRSDSEKKRSLKTAVVCLGLLCVLLLVAVTVLCIKFTKENNLFQSEKDQCFDNPKWITHKLSSYYISSEWKNWTDSRRDCEQRGAHLIIINNEEEQEFVTMVTSRNIVWIGLNEIEEGVWKWVDGSNMTSRFWGKGSPVTVWEMRTVLSLILDGLIILVITHLYGFVRRI